MGLAMQAAAAARIPFVVLDRPNPLGGDYVSGFVLGAGAALLRRPVSDPDRARPDRRRARPHDQGREDGCRASTPCDLRIVEMQGWQRSMRWPQTERAWVATSPSIPTFESALVYPGIGVVGEIDVNEGRGTPTPVLAHSAHPGWMARDWPRGSMHSTLPGVRFEPAIPTPRRAIPAWPASPRFAGKSLSTARASSSPMSRHRAGRDRHARACRPGRRVRAPKTRRARCFANLAMFHAIAGTKRLHRMLDRRQRWRRHHRRVAKPMWPSSG